MVTIAKNALITVGYSRVEVLGLPETSLAVTADYPAGSVSQDIAVIVGLSVKHPFAREKKRILWR